MKMTTIKTNLFRVRYRRDDGSKQLKVLAKIGYQADSKFNELRRFEIPIRDKFNNLHPVTDHKYEKLKALPPSIERLFLFQIETKIKRIILELIEEGKDFTTKDINDRLYSIQTEEYGDIRVKSWNDFLNEINHGEIDTKYQREEIDRIEDAIEEYEKAVYHYKKAISINERQFPSYSRLANALAKAGKIQEAVPYYKKALELTPNDETSILK